MTTSKISSETVEPESCSHENYEHYIKDDAYPGSDPYTVCLDCDQTIDEDADEE